MKQESYSLKPDYGTRELAKEEVTLTRTDIDEIDEQLYIMQGELQRLNLLVNKGITTKGL